MLELLEASVNGTLGQMELKWNPMSSVCVVMASRGYPCAYTKGKPIFGLAESSLFDQIGIVGRIMRRQYSGRILKAIDQQSADVVRGIVDRAHNFLASFLSHPTGSRFQKAGGNVLIVDAIEEAKAADTGLMLRIIIWIVTGHDSSRDFAVSFRQK